VDSTPVGYLGGQVEGNRSDLLIVLIRDLKLGRLRNDMILAITVDKLLFAPGVVVHDIIVVVRAALLPRRGPADRRPVQIRVVSVDIVQLDVPAGLEALVGRAVLAGFAEEVADAGDRGDGADDDANGGLDHGPVHGDAHRPGDVGVGEEGGDKAEADAGGYDGAVLSVSI